MTSHCVTPLIPLASFWLYSGFSHFSHRFVFSFHSLVWLCIFQAFQYFYPSRVLVCWCKRAFYGMKVHIKTLTQPKFHRMYAVFVWIVEAWILFSVPTKTFFPFFSLSLFLTLSLFRPLSAQLNDYVITFDSIPMLLFNDIKILLLNPITTFLKKSIRLNLKHANDKNFLNILYQFNMIITWFVLSAQGMFR